MRRLALVPILCALACSHGSKYYLDTGNQLAAGGKFKDAALNYRKALQRDARSGEAYYRLGLAQIRLREPRDAYASLSTAVDLLPGRDDIAVAAADFFLSAYLADPQRPKVLYDKVASLAEGMPARDSYDALRLQGHLAVSDRNFKKAEDFFSRANGLKPMQPEVIFAWAEALFKDDQPEKAEALARQLIARDKSYEPIYGALFRYYERAGRVGDAVQILKAKAANNPADAKSQIELAAWYARNSNEPEMQACLRRLLDDPAHFPDAHFEVGEFYARRRRWDDALRQFEAGASADPRRRVGYLEKTADLWLAQGRTDRASETVAQILAEQPGNESAKAVQAGLLIANGRPEALAKAVPELQALVAKSPDQPVWRLNLGRALAARGDLRGARTQLTEIIQRHPDLLPPRIALAELSQAAGDHAAALQQADQILKMSPGLTNVRILRAVSLMYTGENARARVELSALENSEHPDRQARLQLAAMDLREKKYTGAELRFRKLLNENGGDVQALGGLAQTLVSDGRTEDALSLLNDAVRKSPNATAVRSILARTAAEAGKYDLAVGEYRRLLASAPGSVGRNLDLGNALMSQGDLPSAIASFEKASSLAPNDPNPKALRGEALALAGRKPEALQSYRAALRLSPGNPAILNATAWLAAETGGSLDEALELARRAVQADAKQPDYSDTLGWILLKKRLSDSALTTFRGLTARYPGRALFHYHLAMAILQRGGKAEAAGELKRALAAKPPADVRSDAEAALARIGS